MAYPCLRGIFSYSAANLWYSSKPAFRARYYYNAPFISNAQMDFGKEIADMLKTDPENALVAHVPKYAIRDEGFTVTLAGVPILMYPDTLSLHPVPSFREYKTGVVPWNDERVAASMQLKLYSLGIKEKYGSVQNLCHLDWLVTHMVEHVNPILINGKKYDVVFPTPELTGQIVSFPYEVTDAEREHAREWIHQAASEISADYLKFKTEPVAPHGLSQPV